ncbi:MAG TPA: carbohydrate ABC transporter permease [Sellimonas intestinalis]|uniref:carbohydrate ABC transporter permease n=1 Tax=Lachnoclostridium sp. An169 TaxID=1965569 RepID=UPI0017484D2B|nr:carbohydrate ABC transporter permease [Candidatus Mediterraneibacter cottocaccae]HJE99300.1 carbohydrate ABC transporter permease [Sellimonas intestinalis]
MRWISFLVVLALGIVMIYPLIWMFFASFKTNDEINLATALLPQHFDLSGFIEGWKSSGQYTFTDYFINTFVLVVPTVLFTVVSCTVVAYGFARFSFKGNKLLFGIMLSTLMVPNSVLIIPRYLLFRDFGWLNSYMPFWMPALFACYPFFIYQEVQFLRGIPRELDEAAKIDGCGSFQILTKILLPVLKPSMMSICIFQTIWTWNDFMNPLVYINSVSKYPLSLALRMGLDVAASANWNEIMAMACVSVIPPMIMFFCLQKYFVEGIATSGLKG